MEIEADKRLNRWRTLHLIIIIGMYLFYAYLWADFLFYTGKPGWKGFYIFTMTAMTIPFYFIYYIILFIIAWLDKKQDVFNTKFCWFITWYHTSCTCFYLIV